MYQDEEVIFEPLNSICNACLCSTRKTFLLGEYANIFNRIMYFNSEDNQHVRVCWECLAVLKKVKVFESKCRIARKILSTKWENCHSPICLSTLVMTPVKIDIHFDEELSESSLGFKFEEKPLVYPRNVRSGNEPYEKYIDCSTNKIYNCTKFEETASLEDHADNRLENDYYVYFQKDNEDNNYMSDNKLHENKLNIRKSKKNNKINKPGDIEQSNKNECKAKTLDKPFKSSSISRDSSVGIKSYISNESSQFEFTDKNINTIRRKGLRKKDLEEHFRIVGVKSKEMKQLKSKFKIDASEVEFWREAERSIEFYIDLPFKCHNCICGFSSLKKKYEHEKKYHDTATGVYTCDICTSQFMNKQCLAAHVSKHYRLHRCKLCEFRCFSRQAVKWHMGRHKRLVMCVHCDACFSNVGLFYKHFKGNHSVFICDHCGKRCRTKYTLEKHMRHHSEKNVCLICNKVYASRNSLRNHSEMKHKETSSEMAYCVKCDKQFPNVPLYKRHVQSSKAHAAERDADRSKKQVNCPVCSNVYSRKTYMMNHYRHVHMKQSKHYCTDCDRHFLNRTRFVEHRKYHHEGETKAKNKMCNICGRGFAANRTLVNHIRTHSGERPYECQYCDAKFTQKHGMLSHIKYIHMKSKRRGYQ